MIGFNAMKLHESLTYELIKDSIESGDYMGFCIKCGAEHYGVEPDARGYECEECESESVYGAEELLFMIPL
jgi:DNA-directed RNA polymerase subunit RPC12/RpoP